MTPDKKPEKKPKNLRWIVVSLICVFFAMAAGGAGALPTPLNAAVKIVAIALFGIGAVLALLAVPVLQNHLVRWRGRAPNRTAVRILALSCLFVGFYAYGHLSYPPEPTKASNAPKPQAAVVSHPPVAPKSQGALDTPPAAAAPSDVTMVGHWILPLTPAFSKLLTIREHGGKYELEAWRVETDERKVRALREVRSSKGRKFSDTDEVAPVKYSILEDNTLDVRDADGFSLIARPYYGDAQNREAVRAAMGEIWTEVSCREDADCWIDQHRQWAYEQCVPLVERQARYEFKWTNGWMESKFRGARWHGKDGKKLGLVDYIGDKIMLQNGFGAFQNYVYICTFDVESGLLVNVELRPGRLNG